MVNVKRTALEHSAERHDKLFLIGRQHVAGIETMNIGKSHCVHLLLSNA